MINKCPNCGVNLITERKTETINLEPLPADLEILLDVADKRMSWDDAMEYAKSLGDGWRLPTKFELQAIAESLPETSKLKQLICWSASTQSCSTAYAWRVDLFLGATYYNGKPDSNAVLCVR